MDPITQQRAVAWRQDHGKMGPGCGAWRDQRDSRPWAHRSAHVARPCRRGDRVCM